jgi:hypothetical protein
VIKRLGRFSKNGILKTLQEQAKAKAANNTVSSVAASEPQETEEQKALRLASAITSNGRTTPAVNNTTNAASSETINDGLLEYVGDVRARASRRKRGAPMANGNGTLGQPTILGV